jgi:hypothetical protein
MMPLPLQRLIGIGEWLEENCAEVVHEMISNVNGGAESPNPMVLVTRVLGKIDVAQLALNIFSYPKDPDTMEPLNPKLSKEFYVEFLDIPVAHKLFKDFVEINDIGELIKNLQSLPVVRKIMEAANLTFGIPYLNTLLANMDSTQKMSEGSPSLKSTPTSSREDIAEMEFGEEKLRSSQRVQ